MTNFATPSIDTAMTWLQANAPVTEPNGGAARIVREATGVGQSTIRSLLDQEFIVFEGSEKRWLAVDLTDKGRAWTPAPSNGNGGRTVGKAKNPGALKAATAINAYLRECECNDGDSPLARRSDDALRKRARKLDADIAVKTGVTRLKAMQELRDVTAEIARRSEDGPKADFVKYAAAYGEKHGIEYETWRDVGVPAMVLKEAGIGR